MRKLSFLPVLALLLAVAGSAFSIQPTSNLDLVWFEVNSSGAALDPTDGHPGTTPPPMFNCSGSNQLCSRALSISEGEVTDNGDGTYSIATGISIQQRYNDQRQKQ